MLIDLVKRFPVFHNVVAGMISRVPPMVEHNLSKYTALKKAFYLSALDGLDGDYLEFGVFMGSSLVFASKVHLRMNRIYPVKTRFWGFDSFCGFGRVADHDKHPFYVDSIFRVDADRVIRNIKRQTRAVEVGIVKGFFDETLKGKSVDSYGIGKARIIFIDCDLMDPALLALNFCYPILQTGTILVMDDYLAFGGADAKGVTGAFSTFNREHLELRWRKMYDYGYGGVAFVLTGY